MCAFGANAVDFGEEEVGAVGAGLVPTLDGGTDGTSGDSQEQLHGQPPFVLDLESQRGLLGRVQSFGACDVLAEELGLLGHEGALAEEGNLVREALLLDKSVNIAHELVVRDALEGVFDPGEAWLAGHGRTAMADPGGEKGTIDVLGLEVLVDIDVLVGVVSMFEVVARHALGLAAMDTVQLAKAYTVVDMANPRGWKRGGGTGLDLHGGMRAGGLDDVGLLGHDA